MNTINIVMALSSKIVEPDSTVTLLRKAVTRQRIPFTKFKPIGLRFTQVEPNVKALTLFKEMFKCDELPVSYMFILAFRYLGQVLVTSSIPSKLMGMIHLNSQFSVIQPHDWRLPTEIDVQITSCTYSDKGYIYSLTTKLYQIGQLTLINENQFLDKKPKYQSNKRRIKKREFAEVNVIAKSNFNQMMARQYAKVSGDYNPIHIHPLLAKLFGMKSSIMHGMYGLHWMLTQNDIDQSAKKITVNFNRPCYLPNVVLLTESNDGERFSLYSESLEDRFMQLNFT